MATNDSLTETLEHFKRERAAKMEDIRALEITIRQIQKQLGETPDDPMDAGHELAPPAQITPLGAGTFKPRPDEYFGMPQPEAARTYLEKIGHAVFLDDILKTIVAGGCKVGGVDPKKTLSIVLTQNKREFVPTGNGHFGLRKFYPNMPKLGRPEGTIQVKKIAKGRSKKTANKREAKPKASPMKPKQNDPTEQVQVVQ